MFQPARCEVPDLLPVPLLPPLPQRGRVGKQPDLQLEMKDKPTGDKAWSPDAHHVLEKIDLRILALRDVHDEAVAPKRPLATKGNGRPLPAGSTTAKTVTLYGWSAITLNGRRRTTFTEVSTDRGTAPIATVNCSLELPWWPKVKEPARVLLLPLFSLELFSLPFAVDGGIELFRVFDGPYLFVDYPISGIKGRGLPKG